MSSTMNTTLIATARSFATRPFTGRRKGRVNREQNRPPATEKTR